MSTKLILTILLAALLIVSGTVASKMHLDSINAQAFTEIKARVESLEDLPVGGKPVRFEEKDGSLDIYIENSLIARHLWGSDLPKPILYDVQTPSGNIITRQVPFDKDQRDALDHPHHTGIFFTYAEVNGENFWSNTSAPPQIKQIDCLTNIDEYGTGKISVVNHWILKSGKVVLEEKRDMTFKSVEDGYVIDFDIELAAQDKKVTFEDTKEGMFAIRLADWITEIKGTGRYFSSTGLAQEKQIWGTRAEWVCIQGKKDNSKVGVAIINKKDSINYPTFWHVRGYGMFAANPLGQYVFEKRHNLEKAKGLNLKLLPGQTCHFGFRMHIYEGNNDKNTITP